jgi:hypothetical protein
VEKEGPGKSDVAGDRDGRQNRLRMNTPTRERERAPWDAEKRKGFGRPFVPERESTVKGGKLGKMTNFSPPLHLSCSAFFFKKKKKKTCHVSKVGERFWGGSTQIISRDNILETDNQYINEIVSVLWFDHLVTSLTPRAPHIASHVLLFFFHLFFLLQTSSIFFLLHESRHIPTIQVTITFFSTLRERELSVARKLKKRVKPRRRYGRLELATHV